MTTQQLILMTCAYLVVLFAVASFTLATTRRILGAVAGGAVAGWVGLGAMALGQAMELWRVPIRTPYMFWLGYIGLVVSLVPFYLISWRVARRFGMVGLSVGVAGTAIVGPIRDYWVAATFKEWIIFSPGVAPIVAVSATYVSWLVLGHAVMRMVAGPARVDPFRKRPLDAAQQAAGADR